MTKTDHLAKAKDYIAKGEDYYRKAAEEIQSAKREDGFSNRQIAAAIGKSESWVATLLRNVQHHDAEAPFSGGEVGLERRERSVAKKVARERPEAIAEAIEAAPPEAQREIADRLLVGGKTERSLRSVVQKRIDPPDTPYLPKAESKLGDGVFKLYEASELLMDETPSDDARVRMASMAETAQRLAAGIGRLVDTGEFDQEFGDLVKEVGADR